MDKFYRSPVRLYRFQEALLERPDPLFGKRASANAENLVARPKLLYGSSDGFDSSS
jgi:hypothetical protein